MDVGRGHRDAQLEAGERRRLIGLAYRMLGTTSEAEDAVQEAFLRWHQLGSAERAGITNPAGWLTRVTSRICLDLLGSARARREHYVGEWLPEPVPASAFPDHLMGTAVDDPLDRVTLDESVSTALLVVLETMTPAERVALILHDVFTVPFEEIAAIVGRSPAATRQLASSARRRVRTRRTRPVDQGAHRRLVSAFEQACRQGDLSALTVLLDPTVVLHSDGGGIVRAALNPIIGAAKVARFILGVLRKNPALQLGMQTTTDGPALLLIRGGGVIGVINVHVTGDRIITLWLQLNPHKLTHWPSSGVDASPSGIRDSGSGPQEGQREGAREVQLGNAPPSAPGD